MLGDHQPHTFVSGDDAGHDVPITRHRPGPGGHARGSPDWGWQDGLQPAPDAPVWRMDTFRDRFLVGVRSAPGVNRGPARDV